MGITHNYVATPEPGDNRQVNDLEWNEEHVVSDGSFTIAKTSGLQAALDGKSSTGHTHTGSFTDTLSLPTLQEIAANVTSYISPNNTPDFADELDVGYIVASPMTITDIYGLINSNGITANTVITLRKNNSPTALTLTYTSGEIGAKTSSGSVSFVAGDILTLSIVGGATGTFIYGLNISLKKSVSVSIT